MGVRLKPLSEQVIVVTGASSGIGLATARRAARQGACVVLAARTKPALDQAVDDITAAGGQALAVVADVTRRDDLDRLARQAVDRFGRIDTWVNNAGVGIWGVLEEVSEADMRQLFDINFWGVVNGSLVAIPHLEASGGGALINVGSVLSDRAAPVQGIYSASKHAVQGFTDALRDELGHRGAQVAVTLIKPWSAATPLSEHVRNYTGHQPVLPPPVIDPERVAAAVLRAARHPTRSAFVGAAGPMTAALANVAPGLLDRVSETVLFDMQLGEPTTAGSDNLWDGNADARVRSQGSSSAAPAVIPRSLGGLTIPQALAAAAGGFLVYRTLRRR
ncbi:SDR family oxidoreductase [Paracoccus endophyticus]|uniref:SDR family oxidoreductase n=1 Tax=Paracoccus endophyticus TaxID=2233774 RepID=UPI000DDB5DC2|nr:SDR family oxidoreductase [Paracoccus endophyticus]